MSTTEYLEPPAGTYSTEVPSSIVIKQQCIAAAFVIINLSIVVKEFQKRRRDAPEFKSRSLRWLSLLSITRGFLLAFTDMLEWLNGFCYFLSIVSDYISKGHPICVGLYQLSRLHRCFADQRVHGGYPKWLFCGMATFGILYLMAEVPFDVMNDVMSTCGVTKHYDYYAVYGGWSYQLNASWELVSTALYLIWDITTLLLLVFKLRAITSSTTANLENEQLLIVLRRNMTRITVLTIFYMMVVAISIIWDSAIDYIDAGAWLLWVDLVLYLLSPTVMSYAVFLMQPHNSREYGRFLNRLIFFKLHFCCCCYREAVVVQRDHFMLKCKAVYKVTASGVELERPLIACGENVEDTDTGTVFNDFSMDDPPSVKIIKYREQFGK